MSNLIATQQIRGGDLIKVDFDSDANEMTFAKDNAAMNGFNRFFIQSHSQRALYSNVLRSSLGIDNEPQYDCPLVASVASFIGIFGVGSLYRYGCRDASTYPIGTGFWIGRLRDRCSATGRRVLAR